MAPGLEAPNGLPAGSHAQPTSGVKTMHPPGTQPPANTPGSSSGRSSTSPAATSHAATTSQELTWATVQSVRAQLGASHPVAVEVARLYSEQEINKGHKAVSASVRAVVHRAQMLWAPKQHSKAVSILQEALSAAEAQLPPDHPSIVLLHRVMAATLHDTARFEEARPHWLWLLPHGDTLAAVIGQANAGLRTHHMAAECLFQSRRWLEARPLLHQVWEMQQRSGQLWDIETTNILTQLMVCYTATSQEPPRDLQVHAVEILTSGIAHIADDSLMVEWLDVLSLYQIHLEQYAAANKTISRLLPLVQRVLGEDHFRYEHMVKQRIKCLNRLKQGAKAQSFLLHSLQTARRQYGVEHPKVVDMAVGLATSYLNDGKPIECVRVCHEAWDAAFRVLGPEHHLTRSLVMMQAQALHDLQGTDHAGEVQEQARARGIHIVMF